MKQRKAPVAWKPHYQPTSDQMRVFGFCYRGDSELAKTDKMFRAIMTSNFYGYPITVGYHL